LLTLGRKNPYKGMGLVDVSIPVLNERTILEILEDMKGPRRAPKKMDKPMVHITRSEG